MRYPHCLEKLVLSHVMQFLHSMLYNCAAITSPAVTMQRKVLAVPGKRVICDMQAATIHWIAAAHGSYT